uniref:LOB domain-containing protein n=1 Tax=Kalanchoe fedtschenkoi TaxID=63787 RepID=A0A7N0UW24_KALFE
MASGVGSPCGACKFLRRKCTTDCIFAPYFCSEQGPARFAAIHKVFGASNVSKLLLHVPVQDRCETVVTIAYEAQARLRDPVYGCVAHIFALQQQVAILQAQLVQVKAQLASNVMGNRNNATAHNMSNNNNTPSSEWPGLIYTLPNLQAYNNNHHHSVSPQSSIESMEQNNGGVGDMKEETLPYEIGSEQKKTRSYNDQLNELQELAFRMMRD